jgi:hypothetical protein
VAGERQSNQHTELSEPGGGETLAATASEGVRSILEAAEASATEIRREAETETREHVRRVAEATGEMLDRLRSMQAELDALMAALDTVRTTTGAPSTVPPRAEPEAGPATTTSPAGAADHPLADGGPGEDLEGARLIALNMALDGKPREETARYLEENFSLSDAGGLLDEVYASVEQ